MIAKDKYPQTGAATGAVSENGWYRTHRDVIPDLL